MSNFICDQCGTYIYEGKGGHYVTGCEHYPIEQMNPTQTPDNEVARLRELLESAIEELSGQAYTEISEAYAALAHAPEEPVIQDSRITEPVSKDISHAFKDCVKATIVSEDNEVAKWFKEPDPVPTQPPTQNDWRELGADEVIQEGDELWITRPVSRWVEVGPQIVGFNRKDYGIPIRTRRPLPKPKEELPLDEAPDWREIGPDEVIQEGDEAMSPELPFLLWEKVRGSTGDRAGDWSDLKFRTRRPLPKREEMPLERQINYLKENGDGLFADCFRYLRDEIQKLKEAK